MLIYHPAFDAYHCVFRLLIITECLPALEFSKLRILDYYICFPAEVALIQLPQDHTEIRKAARAIKNEYRGPVNSQRAFRDMEPIQNAAARLLAASGVFDSRQLEVGNVSRTRATLPDEILGALVSASSATGSSAAVNHYVLHKLSALTLSGLGGLKQRTGLMEHRYDVA